MTGLRALVYRIARRSARWRISQLNRFVLPRADLLVHRMSRGRYTLSRKVAGVQSVVLVHRGRKSGRELKTPVAPIRYRDGWVAGDGNWGLHRRPDWSKNLAARPRAFVEIDGVRIDVSVRRAERPERDELNARLVAQWPAAELYERRAKREIWIWVLEPV